MQYPAECQEIATVGAQGQDGLSVCEMHFAVLP